MRKRLREVAKVARRLHVELLRVEAERRGDPQQSLEQVTGLLTLPDDRERRDEPEGADEERSLLAGTPVVGLVRSVAQHEAVLGEVACDRLERRAQPLVGRRQEAEDRGEQRRS